MKDLQETLKNIDMIDETPEVLQRGSYSIGGEVIPLVLPQYVMKRVQVFLPSDVRRIRAVAAQSQKTLSEPCEFRCENMDAFDMALDRIRRSGLGDKDRVLVLNLANAFRPGGGVRSGARAQEESLCRRSTLLASLESTGASPYYRYNKEWADYLGSDGIIVTPDVEVFRASDGTLLKDSFAVSVMTCAAPELRGAGADTDQNSEEYRTMMRRRIDGILMTAAALGYRHLVLGAFGCGAFRNDAAVVSDLFRQALEDFRPFETVDFAVLNFPNDTYNFDNFSRNFSDFYGTGKTAAAGTGTEIRIVRGDITKVRTDAVVNPANPYLLPGGGACGAIHRTAGPELAEACAKIGGCPTGEARLTDAYRLPCRYVIHTVGPQWSCGSGGEADLLASCYKNTLKLCREHGIRSITFPSVSTGIYGYPVDRAAKTAVTAVREFVRQYPDALDLIQWAVIDDGTHEAYRKALEE